MILPSSHFPRVIGPLASGLYAHINRIDASDIGYDLGTLEGESFIASDTGKSSPPLPGFDPTVAEEWPSESELMAHFTALGNAEIASALAGVQQVYDDATEALLNQRAHSWGYKNMSRATTYAASANPQWAAEAAALVAHRDAVWIAAYAILQDVLNNVRPVPTLSDYLAELPTLPTRPVAFNPNP